MEFRLSTMDKSGCLAISTNMASDQIDQLPAVSGEQLFRLRQISGKGYGLVASQGIKRGTCIIEEVPIIRLGSNASEQESEMVLARRLSELSPEKAEIIDKLYHDPRKVDPCLLQDSPLTSSRSSADSTTLATQTFITVSTKLSAKRLFMLFVK